MKFVDASGMTYKTLNDVINRLLEAGESELFISNAYGHRFIGCGLKGDYHVVVEGVPGNNIGAYMDGPWLEVHGSAQDGVGNTMNSGTIVVHGHAGDIVGYSMRGGTIFINGNVGYRSGIHMKAFEDKYPVVVIGGRAGNFLGEYMAGGVIIVLGNNLPEEGNIVGNYLGTGMHGGVIYVRGAVEASRLAKEVLQAPLDDSDQELLDHYVQTFNRLFDSTIDVNTSLWTKLVPASDRPYGELYSHQ